MNGNFSILTGTYGSGKSTALKLFKQAGFKTLSADKLAKSAYLKDSPIFDKITKILPKSVISLNFEINFIKLRDIFYQDKTLAIKLEQLIHPFVKNEVLNFYNSNQNYNIIYEIPLFFNKYSKSDFYIPIHKIIYIHSDLENILKNTSLRKLNSELVTKIISKQKKPSDLDQIDFMISNNNSLESYKKAILEIIPKFSL